MTERVAGFLILLAGPKDPEDTEDIASLLRLIEGVDGVEPIVVHPSWQQAEKLLRHQIAQQIYDLAAMVEGPD